MTYNPLFPRDFPDLDSVTYGVDGDTVLAFTTSKQGYLVQVTNEQLQDAMVWPVTLPSPEEQAAAKAEQLVGTKRFIAQTTARLATAHPALHPIIELHSPGHHMRCTGCDAGSYAEDSPEWPCRTIDLILAGLGA